MKSRVLSIAAVLLLSQLAKAQMPMDATPGMFGPRQLGLPIMARSSGFTGGVRAVTNGSFYYPSGMNIFAPPWLHTQPALLQQTIAALEPSQVLWQAPSTMLTPATGYNTPGFTVPEAGYPEMRLPETLPGFVPPMGQDVATPEEFIAPAVQGGGAAESSSAFTTPIAVAPSVSTVTIPRAATRTAFRIADRSSLRRSTEASDRLTRIARDRGMLAGPAIDVYLSGNVAILQGVVRTAHDRDLLANVAGLEPGVQQIYNGLATDGSGDRTITGDRR